MSSSHDITLTPQEQALIMRLKSFRVPEMAHILEEQLKDPNADLNTFMERMTANGDIYTCPLIIDEELKENNILRVSDLSEVENGKLYNLKEKLLSQNPKCRTCKVNPFCWNCIATIKENTENGAMDDYCSKVKAFYFNTVWGE